VGQRIDLIVPPTRAEEVGDILRRVGWGETIENYETERLCNDRSLVQVSLSISPIRTPSGKIIGASTTARDITASRRTENALRQQIEERRRIFETSQDLIFVVDPRGVLVQVSPSAETILGYSPKEMIGHDTGEFLHPADLEHVRQEIRRVRRGQRARNTDSRYLHKDGRIVTLSWMGAWSEPVRRYFFVGRDMTESRLAQETLRESEQLARGIIDTALDAFVQIDENGHVRSWNSQAEKIFGWSHDEAVGQKLDELIIPEIHRANHASGIARFLSTGEGPILGRRIEIEALRRDGTEIRVELSVTALKRRDGFLFNGFIRDLTDRIAAEDRIRQAEKMEAVGQLTGGIAHDFNNILAMIGTNAELGIAEAAQEIQLHRLARRVQHAFVAALRDLHDIARLFVDGHRLVAGHVRTEDQPLAVRRPLRVRLVNLRIARRARRQHRHRHAGLLVRHDLPLRWIPPPDLSARGQRPQQQRDHRTATDDE